MSCTTLIRSPCLFDTQEYFPNLSLELLLTFIAFEAVNEVREAFEVTRIGSHAKFPDDNVATLRPALTQLALDTKRLAYRLLKGLAFALNLEDEDFFVKTHDGILSSKSVSKLRTIYYPPITEEISGQVSNKDRRTKFTSLAASLAF